MKTDTPETDSLAKMDIFPDSIMSFREYITKSLNLCRNLERQRDEFARRLQAPVRCHSGHERLPLALWDCPDCVEKIRTENADLRRMNIECSRRESVAVTELAASKAENQRLQILVELSRVCLEGQERRHKDKCLEIERDRDKYADYLCNAMQWVYAAPDDEAKPGFIRSFEKLELTPGMMEGKS